MTIVQSIILGIVQGLTEFIPVSSTAHLLITQSMFGWHISADEAFIFDVLVQLGTLLALIIFYWKDLVSILLSILSGLQKGRPFADPQARLGWYLIVATIPALIAGVVFKNLVEQLFQNPAIEAVIRLLITAVLLLIAEGLGHRTRSLESINWKDALWTGIAQILSVFPGASRSGTTISAGMTRNLDRPAAARFAFLMSVPIMLAAGLYESIDLIKIPHLSTFLPPVLVGFLMAAIVGYLAIQWLLKYLAHHPLYVFSIYCVALGIIVLVVSLVAH